MRIDELTLINYRAFAQPTTFDFKEHFTVIAGINGRGKTSILNCLALLSSRFLPMVSPAPARRGYLKIKPSDVHMNTLSVELTMKVSCAKIPLKYKLSYSKEKRKITPTNLSEVVKHEVRKAYGDQSRADDVAPLVVYYTTDRARYSLPKKLPTKLPQGQAVAYIDALSTRIVDYRDFMARYRMWSIMENAEMDQLTFNAAKRATKAFNKALEVCLDGFRDVEILENPLNLTVKKDGCQLSLEQLSDGERSFLAMICDLVRRLVLANPLLDDPLQGSGVVLIDELELHLHPTWQREVVDKLRHTFPNIQFIATTHSPFIIQSLRPGELINLDPEEFGEYSDKSIEDITEDVMGVDLPQKSERYLRMMNAAEKYYSLLHQARNTKGKELEDLKYKLDTSVEPYSDDPAFTAFLKFQRSHMLREEE